MSKRHTDILLVDIDQWPTGVFADPATVEGRAAWYSFAFYLRTAAATELDIDVTELQAGFRSLNRNSIPSGQAFLCDSLDNGAGYSRWFGQAHTFAELLAHADLNTKPTGLAALWMMADANGASHGVDCDTSCNRCLRDFYNLSYHGLLDWRLALDMARMASAQNVTIDLDSSLLGGMSNYWGILCGSAMSPASIILQRLGYSVPEQYGRLRGYCHPYRSAILIERHPLWTDDHPYYTEAYAAASLVHPECAISSVNPFRVLRRAVDYL